MPKLPQPHYAKLTACLENTRLPDADREGVQEALRKYQEWRDRIESIDAGKPDTLEKFIAVTNQYKRFIELDLIFDSPENFLYRQRGQLKLDNSILE